jgi:hypothetical protein
LRAVQARRPSTDYRYVVAFSTSLLIVISFRNG